jgi:hypothetical protein
MLTALTEANASDWKNCARNLAPLFKKNPSAGTGLLLLQANWQIMRTRSA